MASSARNELINFIHEYPMVDFVSNLLPIEGRLIDLQCGDEFLDGLQDDAYIKHVNAYHVFNKNVFEVAASGEYNNISPREAGEYTYLRQNFRALIVDRLRSRLGVRFDEFMRINDSIAQYSIGRPITVRELRYIASMAYINMYSADFRGSVSDFIDRCRSLQLIFTLNTGVCVQSSDSSVVALGGLGDQYGDALESEFRAAFGADINTVLNSCPSVKRAEVQEFLCGNTEIAAMLNHMEAKSRRPVAPEIDLPQCFVKGGSAGSNFSPTASVALLVDVDLNEPIVPDEPVRDSKKRSWFARIFCCCFAPAE